MKKVKCISILFLLFVISLEAANFSENKSIPDRTKIINVDGWLGLFSTTVGTPSESQYVTVVGENLTANIAVSAVTGYQYSTDDTNWYSTLSLASTFNGNVYIRLTGASVGSPSGYELVFNFITGKHI